MNNYEETEAIKSTAEAIKIMTAEPELFELNEAAHFSHDPNCLSCWDHYPKPCECGGLIHAEFGDEDENCDYWLYTKCDKCGGTEGG